MLELPKVIDVLENLRRKAYVAKRSHFNAANRQNRYNSIVGVPVVIVNIVLGSVFFVMLSEDLPNEAKWTGAFLALLAAVFSGVQTFFNFQKRFEGHRKIGNRYLCVESHCDHLLANYVDGVLSLQHLSDELKIIDKEYQSIAVESETLAVSESDYHKALESKQAKHRYITKRALSQNVVSMKNKVA